MRSAKRFIADFGLAGLLIIGTIIPIAGCALSTRDTVMYHSFNYPSPPRDSESSVPETVMVYNFLLDSSVEMHTLEISYSKGGEKSTVRHRWQENPADMITELVLRDLSNSGLFDRAVDQLNAERYRYAVEGVIRNLQGVVKDGKASALLSIEVTLIDFDAPLGKDKNLFRKTYKTEIPSVDDKPESIVAAFNKGIKEFSSQLRNDIRQVLTKRPVKLKT
jgi:ABC-type uncharacterized transport system auxiliary subunit